MTTPSETTNLSDLTNCAAQVAARLRAQQRPLAIAGHKTVNQKVQHKGFMGRVETRTETSQVPIQLPGWPIGMNRVAVRAATDVLHEVVLSPNGELVTLRIDRAKPDEFRVVSRRARYAVEVAQSSDTNPDWVPTENGEEVAARHRRSTGASEAAQRLIGLISRL